MAGAIEVGGGRRAQRSTVENVEFLVLLELRVQGDPEQPSFIERLRQLGHPLAQINKRTLFELSFLVQNTHDADLVSDQQPSRTIIQREQIERRSEPFSHKFQVRQSLRISSRDRQLQTGNTDKKDQG